MEKVLLIPGSKLLFILKIALRFKVLLEKWTMQTTKMTCNSASSIGNHDIVILAPITEEDVGLKQNKTKKQKHSYIYPKHHWQEPRHILCF